MTDTRPQLSLDFKRNRIRIHQVTLRLLGDPDYVQILVNPDEKTIALRCSNADDPRSHNTSPKGKNRRQCCELTSKVLLDSLKNLYYEDDECNIRITGNLIKKERVAEFKMKDSAPLN